MKLVKSLKTILKEALGVPDGLYETSKDVYKLIVEFLEGNISPNDTVDDVGTLNWEIYGDWSINDLDIEIINIVLEIQDYDDIRFLGMTFNQKGVKVNLPNVTSPVSDEIKITIKLGAPLDTKFGEIINFFKKDKPELLSSIAHELKHAYDFYKKGEHRIEKYVEYGASQQDIVGLRSIRDFLYTSYFLHEFENLVRPSELYSYLMSIDTTKETFLDDLNDNLIINHIKEARTLTYQDIYEDLLSQITSVYGIIKNTNPPFDGRSVPKTVLVDYLLFLVRKTMINNRLDILMGPTQPSPQEALFSALTGQKTQGELLFNKFLDKITSGGKYYVDEFDIQKTPKINEEFFTKKIKQINFEGERMFRKLAKIYDLLPSINDSKQTLNKKISMKPQKEEKIFEFSTDEIGTKEYVDDQWKQGKKQPDFNLKTLEEILKKNSPNK